MKYWTEKYKELMAYNRNEDCCINKFDSCGRCLKHDKQALKEYLKEFPEETIEEIFRSVDSLK